MGRVTYIAVFALLYVQWGESATPIPKDKQYVYSYTGSASAKNSAFNEYASQWTVAAKLVMQSNGNDIVMKLKHIQTNLRNGVVEPIANPTDLPIPEDAHQLQLPFVVHYYKNGSASSISHQAEDPLWSVNMKRAIASIVQIDVEHATGFDGQKFYEESIYGSCEADYSVVDIDTAKAVKKTIHDKVCVNHLENSWSNLARAPAMPIDFNPISTVASRTYAFLKNHDGYILKHIEASSNITYQTMQNEASAQQLVQIQDFHLVSESAITEPIDVSKNTESTSLHYVFDEHDDTSGRKVKQTVEVSKLLQDFKDYYEQFQTDLQKYPLVPGDLGVNNSLMSIFHTLSELDKMDVETIGIILNNDEAIENLFVSMLPYIGNKASIELMKRAFETGKRFELIVIKMLATFPKYVEEYTPELLESLEVLMQMNHTSRHVRHAGVMSFAAMVSEANTRADIPAKSLEKYYSKYVDHFKNAEEYDDQMTYLLGVINMGSVLDTDVMISIIENNKHSHHLRSLAAYGFKPFLISNPAKMFERLWPIVVNEKTVFEVRVAVLDLLMCTDLTQQQFDKIMDTFKEDAKEPYYQHLQNYLVTTITSLMNTTLYSDNLGAKVTAAAERVNISSYYETWTTGNYRISYTDSVPNFGSYFQARLVADPANNAPHIIQLSYNEFAQSLNLGTYSAYIKLDGVADSMFIREFLSDRPDDVITVPELVELIGKFNYKHIDIETLHLELVLFCDDRVVFGMHVNNENLNEYKNSRLIEDLLELLLQYEAVSYPKMYEGHMRSDLGTPVKTYIIETDFVSHSLKRDVVQALREKDGKSGEWNYRSSRYETIMLESYNPIVDVNIAVYKCKSFGQRIHLHVALNPNGQYFTFDHADDAVNLALDKTVGTAVDDEKKLHTYCSACDTDFELHDQESIQKLVDLGSTGVYLEVSLHHARNVSTPLEYKTLADYNGNAQAMPLAEPVMLFWYALQDYYYLGTDSGSIVIRTMENHPDPSESVVRWKFNIDDTHNEHDPINGTSLHAAVTVNCRKKQDAWPLGNVSIMYGYESKASSAGQQHYVGHVEQKHTFRVEYSTESSRDILDIERELKYPDRRADILSIRAVEAAKGKARLSLTHCNRTKQCSSDFAIAFTEIFEPAEHQMEEAEKMSEYQQCKKDSAGLKYTPPTEACVLVHDTVSKYNNYTLYMDLTNAGRRWSKAYELLGVGEKGIKFLEYHYVHGDVVEVKVHLDFVKSMFAVENKKVNDLLHFHTSLGAFSGLENSVIVAYDNYDAAIGLSTSCDVTSKKLNTFTGAEIENYERKDGKETVAFVECFNETQNGLTIQQYADNKIGFTMWAGDDKLVTSVKDGKLSVTLNGAKIQSHLSVVDKHLKIYFLEADVLYISHKIFTMYYNTEYLSVKAPFIYNNYVCGLCARL